MYDYAITEQVSRKTKKGVKALRRTMIVFAVLFVLLGIIFTNGFMLPAFLLVVLYFAYDVFCEKDYEYRLDGTTFTVHVIYGKRYRKEAQELDIKDLEVVAPHWHDSVAKYKIKGGTQRLKKYDYTSYDEDTPYYTMIIMSKHQKIKLLLDLNEQMLHAMKQMYPEKVFFA